MGKTKPQTTQQAILDVLKVEPSATVAQIAVSAGVGRSTAGKMLAELESDGKVHRTPGGRDGARRLPDQWAIRPSTSPTRSNSNANGTRPTADGKPERLKAGGLDPLVLAYLKKNAGSGPHGPTTIAKALGRSSGAVSNCLTRLTDAKKAKLATEKPRRYTLA